MNFRGEVRFLRCVSGKTLGADDGFIRKLKEGIPGLREEFNVENCDFILVFCPVVSRAGTDIEAALKKLIHLSKESKNTVLVVLHHTFDQEMTVADSSRSVNRENTLTVDCLFHEDRGLLQCYRNQEALEKVTHWIKPPVPSLSASINTFKDFFSVSTRTAVEIQEKPKSKPMWKQLAECEENNKRLQLKNEELTKLLCRTNKILDPIISKKQKNLENRQFRKLSDLLNDVKKQLQIPEKETTKKGKLDISPDLRLVLLGRAGSVKSSVGNSILKNRETESSTPTQGYKIRQGFVGNKSLTVLETPDELFSEFPQEEIRHCVRLSAPGPHAFLIVIPVEEWTGEERGMLEEMEEKFGEKCWRNTIILLTVTDEEQKKRVEEFIRSGNQEVQRLVEKCGNRFHCLNVQENRDDAQVLDLLEKIEKMLKDNPERFYSREIYQQIREMERRVMDIVLGNTKEDIQAHEEYIESMNEKIPKLDNSDKVSIQNLLKVQDEVKRRLEKLNLKKTGIDIRYAQDKMMEAYDGEGWIEDQKQLMEIMLPEVHSMLWDSQIQRRKSREQVKNTLPETHNQNPDEAEALGIYARAEKVPVASNDSSDPENTPNTRNKLDDLVQELSSNGHANAEEENSSNVLSSQSSDKMSDIKIQRNDTDQKSKKNANSEGSPVLEELCPKDVSDQSSDNMTNIKIQPDEEVQNKSPKNKNANEERSPVDEGASSIVPSVQSPEKTADITNLEASSSGNANAGESPVSERSASSVSSDSSPENTSNTEVQRTDKDLKESSSENRKAETSPEVEDTSSSVSSAEAPENTYL
ncbi:uncharacterized protein LOC111189988 isoform X1 [Astyanax mexicanus]|uniref:uncharacterized protein LOC111189988 isoform X1 n=1 Tax=Astyanax mexicanus TaxID=7994 RepID=UPI0020CB2FFA|nr:uncharacterized protein LOC111189988 isoform X1 [Astyanax mexicanus]